MSTHANDVAHVIREAVIAYSAVASTSELHWTPNPEQGFPNRDGRLEFVAVPQDCFRGFRVTVEAITLDEAFALQDDFNEEARRRAAV